MCIRDSFNAEDIAEFPNPVGFVDSMLGDIDGRRATQAHGKLRDQLVKESLYPLSLAEIRIPLLLFFQRSLLPQPRKRDLAPPVFNDISPRLLRLEVRRSSRLL